MNQLNLLQENSDLPIKFANLENFLFQKRVPSFEIINVTTGLYGMLVFNKIIDDLFKEKKFIKISNTNIKPTINTSNEENYITYKLFNGQELKLTQDNNLDNTGNINEQTGFTIESSTLYLKN
jgi:hypothetical protein